MMSQEGHQKLSPAKRRRDNHAPPLLEPKPNLFPESTHDHPDTSAG